MAATSRALFGAAELNLMIRSAALVKAALAEPRMFFTLQRQLLTAAVQTAAEVQQRIPLLVRRLTGGVPQSPQTTLIAAELTQVLDAATRRIPSFADRAYEAAFMEASFRQSMGMTPRRAMQGAWRSLMEQGITGFTDSRGHNWSLASYTEMAVRTATARLYRYVDRQRMLQQGVSLYLVSSDERPCPRCAPWEGMVLAEWPGVGYPTLADATRAGLFHPNCLHVLTGFVPGRTQTSPPEPWSSEKEAAYRAEQRQRRLERALRAAKRQRDGAISAGDRAAARQRIAVLEAQLQVHTQQNDLPRQKRRESPNLGFTLPKRGQ